VTWMTESGQIAVDKPTFSVPMRYFYDPYKARPSVTVFDPLA